MDNASDYGSEDSRFESWQVRSFYPRPHTAGRQNEGRFESGYIEYVMGFVSVAPTLKEFFIECFSNEVSRDLFFTCHVKKYLENPGIDPGTSHMLSERSTI